MSRNILLRCNQLINKISNYRELGRPSKEDRILKEFKDSIPINTTIEGYTRRAIPFYISKIEQLPLPESGGNVKMSVIYCDDGKFEGSVYENSTNEYFILNFDGPWTHYSLPYPVSIEPYKKLTTFQKLMGKTKEPNKEFIYKVIFHISIYLNQKATSAKINPD